MSFNITHSTEPEATSSGPFETIALPIKHAVVDAAKAAPRTSLWPACLYGIHATFRDDGAVSVHSASFPFIVKANSYHEAVGKATALIPKCEATKSLPRGANWMAVVNKKGDGALVDEPDAANF